MNVNGGINGRTHENLRWWYGRVQLPPSQLGLTDTTPAFGPKQRASPDRRSTRSRGSQTDQRRTLPRTSSLAASKRRPALASFLANAPNRTAFKPFAAWVLLGLAFAEGGGDLDRCHLPRVKSARVKASARPAPAGEAVAARRACAQCQQPRS